MPRPGEHGPLPPLMILMTVVSGLVDAFSFLLLGRVFVSNMTGNVIFLGFAVAGIGGFVWWTSVLALATFCAGAVLGGRIANRHGRHRGRHLLLAVSFQAVFVIGTLVVAVTRDAPYDRRAIVAMIALLSIGMGVQNATARALGVPELTTTVVTRTIAGIASDSRLAGGPGGWSWLRATSVASVFVGAAVGALLVHAGHGRWILLIAVVLLGFVAAVAAYTVRSTAAWTVRRSKP
jgi:uncharacterized membrane protein YoaK (UPF0700 family)